MISVYLKIMLPASLHRRLVRRRVARWPAGLPGGMQVPHGCNGSPFSWILTLRIIGTKRLRRGSFLSFSPSSGGWV